MKKYFNIITIIGIIALFISVIFIILTVTSVTPNLVKHWEGLWVPPVMVIMIGLFLGKIL